MEAQEDSVYLLAKVSYYELRCKNFEVTDFFDIIVFILVFDGDHFEMWTFEEER